MATPAHWLPDLRLEVPGAPEPTLERYVAYAAETWGRLTHAWTDTLTLAAEPGVTQYALVLPEGARFVRLTEVELDEARVCATATAAGVLTLDRAPQEAGEVSVGVVLTPDPDSGQIPDLFRVQYRDGIRSLALAGLYSLPGQTWTNGPLALVHQQAAQAAIGDARIRLNQHHSATPLRVGYRPGGWL